MAHRNEPLSSSAKAKTTQLLDCIIRKELSRPPKERKPFRCPHCKGSELTKRGHDAYGRQRYFCKRCKRSFTTTTGKALSSTNMPVDTWLAFARCHIGGLTLRSSAAACGVSLKTAFYMRRRLVATIHEYSRQVKKLKANTRSETTENRPVSTS